VHANDNDHNADAVSALADRDYVAAGDSYTRAAWSILEEPRDGKSPFEEDERGYVGVALQEMVLSAVCYRVAGRDDRAESRSAQGIAVSEDLMRTFASPVQKACLEEFVADLHAVLGDERAKGAYESTAESYASAVGDSAEPQSVATTALFRAAAAPAKQLGRSLSDGEIAVDWDDLHGPDPSEPARFLGHRAVHKQKRFPSLIEGVVSEGFLAAPRGTTEYATDHHRCPECGSEDVNWVADSVLCLRCSRPTEPQ